MLQPPEPAPPPAYRVRKAPAGWEPLGTITAKELNGIDVAQPMRGDPPAAQAPDLRAQLEAERAEIAAAKLRAQREAEEAVWNPWEARLLLGRWFRLIETEDPEYMNAPSDGRPITHWQRIARIRGALGHVEFKNIVDDPCESWEAWCVFWRGHMGLRPPSVRAFGTTWGELEPGPRGLPR